MRTPILKLVCAAILLAGSTVATTTTAGELGGILHNLTTPVRALHRKKPPACQDDVVDRLADEIDWLQAHINSYGSIVAKHPDVWGQNRLTRARYEYEEQLRAQLGAFQELNNASLRRSDQAFLGLALAMGQTPATGRGTAATTRPAEATASVTNLISNPVGGGSPAETVIARTPPFAATSQPFADFGLANSNAVSLEPTIHLDHLSRYLNHLHELRRINEGDDIADAPGYALNLVRIPVSITPGQHTQAGHGAEVTVTADPQLGDDLLPTTFRNLVLNDLVDMLAPGLTFAVNTTAVRQALSAGQGICPGPIQALSVSDGISPRPLAIPRLTPGAFMGMGCRCPIQALSVSDGISPRPLAIPRLTPGAFMGTTRRAWKPGASAMGLTPSRSPPCKACGHNPSPCRRPKCGGPACRCPRSNSST